MLFTIPLRRAMVVNSDLPYPEGVAAAEILKAGNHEEGDSGVKDIAYGGIFAATVAFFTNGLRVVADGTSAWGEQWVKPCSNCRWVSRWRWSVRVT